MYSWQRIQISQTPGKRIALAGVVLALVGLMGSLFIRSRRVWVRAVAVPTDGGTLVEVAGLERSGGGDVRSVLDDLVKDLRAKEGGPPMTDAAWGDLSQQAIAAAGVVYFLALIAHLVEWSSFVGGRKAAVPAEVAVGSGAGGDAAYDDRPASTSPSTSTGSRCSAGSGCC